MLKQGSLLNNSNSDADISGLMIALKSSLRKIAGNEESKGRDLFVDEINRVAKENEVKLTGGNTKSISKDTFDKWLSPSDMAHTPSLLALMVFCIATKNTKPLVILVKSLGDELANDFIQQLAQVQGKELMTREDMILRDFAKAHFEEKKLRKRKKKLEETIYE